MPRLEFEPTISVFGLVKMLYLKLRGHCDRPTARLAPERPLIQAQPQPMLLNFGDRSRTCSGRWLPVTRVYVRN
jgi:hypothetical protein